MTSAPSTDIRVLVVAKAPLAGTVKTRLGEDVGMTTAAELAAGALRDTLAAVNEAVPPHRAWLALDGDLAEGEDAAELAHAVRGWRVCRQHGSTFADRLAHAHGLVDGPVVQIGMDTPQLTVEHLHGMGRTLDDAAAGLGSAEDGGWWALALREGSSAEALRTVEMSTSRTAHETTRALESRGCTVAHGPRLRDVDTEADAHAVAAAAPHTLFAHRWRALDRRLPC